MSAEMMNDLTLEAMEIAATGETDFHVTRAVRYNLGWEWTNNGMQADIIVSLFCESGEIFYSVFDRELGEFITHSGYRVTRIIEQGMSARLLDGNFFSGGRVY